MSDQAWQRLAGRISNMFARGRVRSVNAAGKMQVLQLDLLAGETKDRLEHFEPYGITSHPLDGAEAAAAFLDGDRSHGLVLVVADRRYRLVGLQAGEMAIHDDQGQKVHLTRTGIVINGGGLPINVVNTPSVTIDSLLVSITGDLQVDGDAVFAGTVTNAGKNIGSTHTHGGVDPGASNTAVPN